MLEINHKIAISQVVWKVRLRPKKGWAGPDLQWLLGGVSFKEIPNQSAAMT